jgi:hypothetical protein
LFCSRRIFSMQDNTLPPVAAPAEHELQADPELALSGGRISAGQIVVTGFAIVAILSVFIYGVNHQRTAADEAAIGKSTTTAAAEPAAPPASRQSAQGAKAQRGEAQAPGQAPASPSAATKAPPPSSTPSKPKAAQVQSGANGPQKTAQPSSNQQGSANPAAGTVSGRGDSSTDNMGAAPAKSRNGTPPANASQPK